MSLPQLPTELVLAIFIEAAEASVVQSRGTAVYLALVSRVVYTEVAPILYRTLKVTDENAHCVVLLLADEKTRARVCALVRQLWVHIREPDSDAERSLSPLAGAFPNLRAIYANVFGMRPLSIFTAPYPALRRIDWGELGAGNQVLRLPDTITHLTLPTAGARYVRRMSEMLMQPGTLPNLTHVAMDVLGLRNPTTEDNIDDLCALTAVPRLQHVALRLFHHNARRAFHALVQKAKERREPRLYAWHAELVEGWDDRTATAHEIREHADSWTTAVRLIDWS